MDSTKIYEYILSRMNDDLAPFGYCRSGKSTLFYRYSLDKKVACCIELQKSMFNSPESYSFTFNLLCVGIYDLDGYFNDKLTISAVKKCFQNPFITERIGILCYGRDYWWKITDDILQKYTVEDYYSRFIHNDIEKAVYHLKELSEMKEQCHKYS